MSSLPPNIASQPRDRFLALLAVRQKEQKMAKETPEPETKAGSEISGPERKVKQESAEAPKIPDKKTILEQFATNQGPETWDLSGHWNSAWTLKFSEKELIQLANSLAKNKRIKELRISKIIMYPEMCQALGEALAQNQTLQSLTLDNNVLRTIGIALIAPGLASNRSLTSLVIKGNGIYAEGAASLATIFEKNTTLTSLTLDENAIQAQGIDYLCDKLRSNRSLKRLAIYFDHIDMARHQSIPARTGSENIADLLKCNHTITELRFSNCDAQFDIIFEALHTNKGLLMLSLPNHRLDEKAAIALRDMLGKNETLTALDISDGSAEPEEQLIILEGLRFNKALTSLDLRESSLDPETFHPETAEQLLKKLEHNRSLTEINLKDCSYDDDDDDTDFPEATKSLINETLQRNTETNKLQERLALVSGFHSRLGAGTAVYNMSKDPVFERRCLIPIFQFLGCETLNQRKFLDTSPKALPAPDSAAALEDDAENAAPADKSLLFSTLHQGLDKAEPVKDDIKNDPDKSGRSKSDPK